MKPFPFPLPLVLDGSTGVMLSAAGMPEGVCTEQWVLEHPDILRAIQQKYVQAGSRAVYAPTFCANRVKLAGYGLADRVAEMNRALVALSREAVGEQILVGGDMTSLGLFLKPFGEASFEDFVKVYREQAEALESAGVDFFIVETLMSLAEARAAVTAIRSVSEKPVWITVTCDEHGRMLSGTSAAAALVVLQGMGVDAFGLNCSVGPDAMVPVLREIAPYAQIPLIVKPNAGLPCVENGCTVFHLTPEEFASHTRNFAACGVAVFGGCCGTDDRHIAALARELEQISVQPPCGDAERVCASDREIFPMDDSMSFGERIMASDELADDLMDADEEDTDGVWLHIEDETGLAAFEENQYLVRKPLKLTASMQELLLAAFRVYQGRAVCEKQAWTPKLAAFGAISQE